MSIDWKEPPGQSRGRKRSALTIYEDLKENPGKWRCGGSVCIRIVGMACVNHIPLCR